MKTECLIISIVTDIQRLPLLLLLLEPMIAIPLLPDKSPCPPLLQRRSAQPPSGPWRWRTGMDQSEVSIQVTWSEWTNRRLLFRSRDQYWAIVFITWVLVTTGTETSRSLEETWPPLEVVPHPYTCAVFPLKVSVSEVWSRKVTRSICVR